MIPDRALRQFLAGALEPPEEERVRAALAADPALRERLALLLATTPADPPPRPVLPPPGVSGGLAGRVEPVAVMGGEPSDWFVARFDPGPEHATDRIVVLERDGEDWRVVFPASADEDVRVADLPRDGDQARLDLRTSAHRAAIALVPADWPLDWAAADDERWEPTLARIGELPVLTFGR